VPGVAVSNGDDIVRTDERGEFVLPATTADDGFVQIEIPAGFAAAAAWFLPAAEPRPVFRLQPVPVRDRLRLLHLTDSHSGVAEQPHYVSPVEFREDLASAIAAEQPDLVFVTGDLTDLGRHEDLEAYAGAVAGAGVPVISLCGGHDGLSAARASTDTEKSVTGNYEAVLGPVQQALRVGLWLFVVCPEQYRLTTRQLRRLDRWFTRVLDSTNSEDRIVLVTHDPPTWHPEKKPSRSGPTLKQFPPARIPELVLHGQYHSTRVFAHAGTTIVGSASCSMGGIDGSPRSYSVIDLSADAAPRIRTVPFRRRAMPFGSDIRPLPAPRWRMDLGHTVHQTSPVIAGDLALLTVADFGDGPPGVSAVDVHAGTLRWRLQCEAVIKHSAVIDESGGRGYVVTVAGTVLCFAMASGKVIWRIDLPNFPDRWLYVRPLLRGDALILPQTSACLALHADTGRILWQHGQQWENGWNLFPLESAATEDRFFSLQPHSFSGFALVCRAVGDGHELWRRPLGDLPEGYDRVYQLLFASPLLVADTVIVPGLAERVIALDIATGLPRWTAALGRKLGPAACRRVSAYYAASEYATGFGIAGETLIVTTAHGWLLGADSATGALRWEFAAADTPLIDTVPYYRESSRPLAPPLVIGDRVVFGGADGRLRVHAADDGRELASSNVGSPITQSPARCADDALVVTFDGDLTRRPLA